MSGGFRKPTKTAFNSEYESCTCS